LRAVGVRIDETGQKMGKLQKIVPLREKVEYGKLPP